MSEEEEADDIQVETVEEIRMEMEKKRMEKQRQHSKDVEKKVLSKKRLRKVEMSSEESGEEEEEDDSAFPSNDGDVEEEREENPMMHSKLNNKQEKRRDKRMEKHINKKFKISENQLIDDEAEDASEGEEDEEEEPTEEDKAFINNGPIKHQKVSKTSQKHSKINKLRASKLQDTIMRKRLQPTAHSKEDAAKTLVRNQALSVSMDAFAIHEMHLKKAAADKEEQKKALPIPGTTQRTKSPPPLKRSKAQKQLILSDDEEEGEKVVASVDRNVPSTPTKLNTPKKQNKKKTESSSAPRDKKAKEELSEPAHAMTDPKPKKSLDKQSHSSPSKASSSSSSKSKPSTQTKLVPCATPDVLLVGGTFRGYGKLYTVTYRGTDAITGPDKSYALDVASVDMMSTARAWVSSASGKPTDADETDAVPFYAIFLIKKCCQPHLLTLLEWTKIENRCVTQESVKRKRNAKAVELYNLEDMEDGNTKMVLHSEFYDKVKEKCMESEKMKSLEGVYGKECSIVMKQIMENFMLKPASQIHSLLGQHANVWKKCHAFPVEDRVENSIRILGKEYTKAFLCFMVLFDPQGKSRKLLPELPTEDEVGEEYADSDDELPKEDTEAKTEEITEKGESQAEEKALEQVEKECL